MRHIRSRVQIMYDALCVVRKNPNCVKNKILISANLNSECHDKLFSVLEHDGLATVVRDGRITRYTLMARGDKVLSTLGSAIDIFESPSLRCWLRGEFDVVSGEPLVWSEKDGYQDE